MLFCSCKITNYTYKTNLHLFYFKALLTGKSKIMNQL